MTSPAEDMKAFDMLPPNVRKSISGARFRFAAAAALQKKTLPAAFQSYDEVYAMRAYAERGFSKADIILLIEADRRRNAGS